MPPTDELTGIARLMLQRANLRWIDLDLQMKWCDERIEAHARSPMQFGAWLGLVPRQTSDGGKARLGRLTKRGDIYLQTLLIQGAKSTEMTAGKRRDCISQ